MWHGGSIVQCPFKLICTGLLQRYADEFVLSVFSHLEHLFNRPLWRPIILKEAGKSNTASCGGERRCPELGEPKEVSARRICSIILPLTARQTESAPMNDFSLFVEEECQGGCKHHVSTHSPLCSWMGRLTIQNVKGLRRH